MKVVELTAFDLAQRYAGIKEYEGGKDHPLIQWWLSLCGFGTDSPDETPWCSAFVNGIAWELRLPRSKSAAARSWLMVGSHIQISEAVPGFDVVILQRGDGPQPGPDVIAAQGHVGFFAGQDEESISVLGGNQGNSVSTARFLKERVLGIRRLV